MFPWFLLPSVTFWATNDWKIISSFCRDIDFYWLPLSWNVREMSLEPCEKGLYHRRGNKRTYSEYVTNRFSWFLCRSLSSCFWFPGYIVLWLFRYIIFWSLRHISIVLLRYFVFWLLMHIVIWYLLVTRVHWFLFIFLFTFIYYQSKYLGIGSLF